MFTFTAVAIIALGIGSSTAVFSIVNPLVLRGLPFPDAGRLVRIVETYQPDDGPQERRAVSYPDYLDWKAHTTAFTHMGTRDFENVALTSADAEPMLVGAAFLSPAFFPMLGVTPALGRVLVDADDKPENLVAS